MDGGGGPQLLLPRPPRAGDGDPGRRRRRPTTATTSRSRCWRRCRAVGGVHARRHAVGGGARAAPGRARRARWRPALAAVVVCIVLGNLAGVREWLDAADPPGDYDWFAPSRVIPDTINEFPWFSFTLGDLHAHVLAIPFTLAGARVRAAGRARRPARRRRAGAARPRRWPPGWRSARCTRSTRGRIPSSPACWCWRSRSGCDRRRARGRRAYAVVWTALVLLASVVLVLPFLARRSTPAARGIGWVDERRSFTHFVGDQALLYGLFAGPLAAAFAARVLVHPAARCGSLVWSARGGARSRCRCSRRRISPGSPPLAGAARGRARRAALAAGSRRRSASCGCWSRRPDLHPARPRARLRPRRVRRDSDLYRMNTVFKLGYQAWLLLAVAAACALPWAGAWLPRRGVAGVGGAHRGPAAARRRLPLRRHLRAQGRLLALTVARRARLAAAERARRPGGDRVAARRTRPARRSCSRRSARTTRRSATRASPPSPAARPCSAGPATRCSGSTTRRAARRTSRTLYTTTDLTEARELIGRYGVDYVVFGPIERTTYGDAGPGQVGRARRQRVRPRRHHGLAAAALRSV